MPPKSVEKEQLFAQYVALHPKGHGPNENISTDRLKKQIAHLEKGGIPGKKLACSKRPANASQVSLQQPANVSQVAPSNSNDMLNEDKRRRCNVKPKTKPEAKPKTKANLKPKGRPKAQPKAKPRPLTNDMPGMIALRNRYVPKQPFRGLRIACVSHLTMQTAAFIETLALLGALVQVAPCKNFSIDEDAIAALRELEGVEVYASKGQSAFEYWGCIDNALTWENQLGPDLVVDVSGRAAYLIHKGKHSEAAFALDGSLPVIECELSAFIRSSILRDPEKWSVVTKTCQGMVVDSEGAASFLHGLAAQGALWAHTINMNNSKIKSDYVKVRAGLYDSFTMSMLQTNYILAIRHLVDSWADVDKTCGNEVYDWGRAYWKYVARLHCEVCSAMLFKRRASAEADQDGTSSNPDSTNSNAVISPHSGQVCGLLCPFCDNPILSSPCCLDKSKGKSLDAEAEDSDYSDSGMGKLKDASSEWH